MTEPTAEQIALHAAIVEHKIKHKLKFWQLAEITGLSSGNLRQVVSKKPRFPGVKRLLFITNKLGIRFELVQTLNP